MGVFDFQDTSRTEDAKVAGLIDALVGRYRVAAMEMDKDGRRQHKCVAWHNQEEVLVLSVGRKEHSTDASTPLLSSNKLGSDEATRDDRSSYLDRFEVRSGKDTFIYIVQATPESASSFSSSSEQRQNVHGHQSLGSNTGALTSTGRPLQRPAPCLSTIHIYKRGEGNLEVDIPSEGLSEKLFREHTLLP